MKVRLSISLASIFLALCQIGEPCAIGQESKAKKFSAAENAKLVTKDAQRSINRGLTWLSSRQHDNGSFGPTGSYGQNVAVTALSGMAFLSSGSTPGRGPYGLHTQRATNFILAQCKPDGFVNVKQSESHGPMYGHGFATLFLAEVYGMSPRADIKKKLNQAVKLIVNTQNKEGGWRYHPSVKDADVSVTVCQIMALRAARNAGIFVPKNTVDKCIDYVKRCQNKDGGFRYRLVGQSESLFPRSAAGVVALYSAGVYEGPEIDKGIGYLSQYLPQGGLYHFGNHYFYGQYYAVQAMWQAGGTHWKRWYPAIREELRRRQKPEGSWQDTSICNEYGTAMALVVLQMPNSYLPIFDR